MGQGRSLHIGVDRVDPTQYAGWSGVTRAAEADALAMASVAKSCGFAADILTNETATREALRTKLDLAARTLASGDILLLSFAGHGGEVPDPRGDTATGMARTWALHDGQWLDSESLDAWHTFSDGVRVVLLVDASQPGTVTRMALSQQGIATGLPELSPESGEVRARFIPPDVALRTYRQNKRFYVDLSTAIRRHTEEPPLTIRAIMACQDNQVALEGNQHGLFTAALLYVWNEGAFRGTYRKLHNALVRRMPATQTPNHFVRGPRNEAFDAERPFTI